MEWNKHHPFTRAAFCECAYTTARETMRGLRTDLIDGVVHLPYWWRNGEIRVSWEPGVSQETVDLIVCAVDRRTREVLDMPFNFQLLGSHPSSVEQIAGATVRGHIDWERLFASALSEHWRDESRDGRQHADIYITTKSFLDDHVSWAAAHFRFGAMVFCLHGQRQHSREFLQRVASHETNHLLGMSCHCDDFQNVVGLPYTPNCNMHYACTHSDLCLKCRTFLQWWWQGVQDEVRGS